MGIYRKCDHGHMGIYRKCNHGHMGIYGKISKLWIILERMLWASSMDNFGKNVMGFVVRLRGPMGPWAHGSMGPGSMGPWVHAWTHGPKEP